MDGQQRLTSLYAVVKSKEVVRANFRREHIRIAFNPLLERFDVADASTIKDKAYIPDIAALWQPGANLFEIAGRYIEEVSKSRQLTHQEIGLAQKAIDRLSGLIGYSFTALHIVRVC